MVQTKVRGISRFVLPLLLLAGAYACGSSSDDSSGNQGSGNSGGSAGKAGQPCDSDSDCAGGTCVSGTCTAPGSGGSGATGSGATGSGATGSGATGSGATGGAGADGGGAGGAGAAGPGSGAGATPGSHFPGSGKGYRPLTPGCGPETADQCTGTCETGNRPPTDVIRPPATLCFSGTGDKTPNDPAVVIEQLIERGANGKEYVHIRITFDPSFTDNTFGAGACCGWSANRGHTFKDLTSSDHSELLLTDANGNTVMSFKIDLLTADPNSPCGFGTLGVTGGDGSVIQGNPAWVLGVATSLDRNLNGCGYCKNAACSPSGDCTIDSPPTDTNFTPNPGTPNWDYRQVYEVWIDMAAFMSAGFGQAYITYVHSSPAKTTDTITVEPSPCPPEWDKPYCPPSVIQEGGNCFGSTPDGGGGGCPPNMQTYTTSEGATICTPIPYAGYPNRAPCPDGWKLDTASEGRYCIPA